MSKKLTPAQISEYRDDGFTFPVSVLSPGEAAECRKRFEALRNMNEDNRDGTMILFMKPHLVFPWLDELVRHPAILDAVEDLIGPNILLYSDSFIVKEPKTQGVFSMHQDRWGWKLEPMEIVNCWLALTPSNATNGCMKMVPRSHLQGELPHDKIKTAENVISYGQTVTCIDTSNPVDLVLEAGEMSMHDAGTVHASGSNGTDDRRIGFIMRFFPPHMRQFGGPRNSATLVRGKDEFGHWELEPRPRSELDPETLPFHRSILQEHGKYGYVYL
jgi:non-haem Fe2+, alpha-ketoglutarate-dependent halogenase